VNDSSTDGPPAPGWYEVRLQGRLDPRWSQWFDGMTLTTASDGTTLLAGHVVDQAALHGLLGKLRDIGLPLVSVVCVDHDATTNSRHTSNPGD
jgi:hypothetical protein